MGLVTSSYEAHYVRILTSSGNRHGRICTVSCQYGSCGGARDSMTTTKVSPWIDREHKIATSHAGSTHVGETLSTPKVGALMGLLARVGADVDGKCAPLDEALPAPRSHTRVRSLIGVYSVVSLQVRLSVEALNL